MGKAIELKTERRLWRVPTLEEQADRAEALKTETLLFCPDPWALHHVWRDEATGEIQRARCNRWECLYCGPRKVDVWRQLVKIAEPTLFLTLTKAGKTVEVARRAITTFIQALRRGSKGRGPNHIGARTAYPVEYFAVLERHTDFERNGFHWHILLRGVDSISYKEVIQPLWISATRGKLKGEEADEKEAAIGWINRVRNSRAIGYVTKYLTKSLTLGERGTREVKQKHVQVVRKVIGAQAVTRYDENGLPIEEQHAYAYVPQIDEQGAVLTEEVEIQKTVSSKAHRICYSRQFFPERVAAMRKRLFAGMENETLEGGVEVSGQPGEEKERSSWKLVELEDASRVDVALYEQQRTMEVLQELEQEGIHDGEVYAQRKREMLAMVLGEVRDLKRGEYKQRRRKRLLEVLEDMNECGSRLSRRVISVWWYQREQLKLIA